MVQNYSLSYLPTYIYILLSLYNFKLHLDIHMTSDRLANISNIPKQHAQVCRVKYMATGNRLTTKGLTVISKETLE